MTVRTLRVAFVLAAFAAGCAYAQFGLFDLPAYPVFLVRYPSVAKELAIAPTVAAKIFKIERESSKRTLVQIAPTPQHPNSTRPLSLEQMQAEVKRRDSAILALLSNSQKARLKQIGYQYAGGFALVDPHVAKELGLSDGQRQTMHSASLAAMQQYNRDVAIPHPGKFRDRPGDVRASTQRVVDARMKMLKTLAEAVGKTLKPAQLSRWKAMQGKPFPVITILTPNLPRPAGF